MKRGTFNDVDRLAFESFGQRQASVAVESAVDLADRENAVEPEQGKEAEETEAVSTESVEVK